MSSTISISEWLHQLPESPESLDSWAPNPLRKRKRVDHDHQLASPPLSVNTCQMESATTPKKRRVEPGGESELTPRPAVPPNSTPNLSLSDSASSISRASSSSPKKQLMSLRLSDSGIDIKALNPDGELPSPTAADLVGSIEEIGLANDILPHDLKAVITEHLKTRKLSQHKWRHSFRPAGDVDNLPGRIPSFEEVDRICRKATECQEHGHDEISWNYQVHMRLLEAIFEDAFGQCDAFAATSCTSARPHRMFKNNSLSAKMVDLCVYASPSVHDTTENNWAARLKRLSRLSPTQTVNHTDYEPISMRPLLLSIETKKPGVHWDKAQLQIGLWHAAQWSFLDWAVDQKLKQEVLNRGDEGVGAIDGQHESKTDEAESNLINRSLMARKYAALSALSFLPGIIVQGHRWHLILSTFDPKTGKTTLWADHPFGMTQGYLGIYATIAGVRRLTAWARDVYLPWFESNILD